jgi:shikimate dehydrogenase
VGAVNTFWHEDGQLIGDNSDVGGAEMVMRALRHDLAGKDVALIGAGGSAAAIIVAAERCGVSRVRVYNLSMQRALALASRFSTIASASDTIEDSLAGASLVVNATPVGLNSDRHFPVPLELLPAASAVFDLAYTHGETAWVTAARAAGHRAADGEGMLIEQGALSFERWFGIAPDRNAMWKAIH